MKIWQSILDLFFPPRCVICGKENHFLCKNCAESIIPLEHQVCPVCKRESAHGAVCPNCQGASNLDGMFVWASYKHNPKLKQAIVDAKYNGYRDTLVILGNLLLRHFRTEHLGKVVFVPVPLHWWRRLWRGFNQSEVLLESLQNKNLIAKILSRTRYTTPQVKVATREARLNNLKNVFVCETDLSGREEIFVIVDDVSSTGATLEECAQALKKAGAEHVYGLVLARD